MRWPWVLGMLILTAVPAIVGGGLFWFFFEKWTAVILWEIVLLFMMSILIAKGYSGAGSHH